MNTWDVPGGVAGEIVWVRITAGDAPTIAGSVDEGEGALGGVVAGESHPTKMVNTSTAKQQNLRIAP